MNRSFFSCFLSKATYTTNTGISIMRKIIAIILSFLMVSGPISAETTRSRAFMKNEGLAEHVEQHVNKQVSVQRSAQDKCTFSEMLVRLEQNSVTWPCVENAVFSLEKMEDPAREIPQEQIKKFLTQKDKLRKKIISWHKEMIVIDVICYYLGILIGPPEMIDPVTGAPSNTNACAKSYSELIENKKIMPGCFYDALVYYENHPEEFEVVRGVAIQGKKQAQAYMASLSKEKKEQLKWALYFQDILYKRLDKLVRGDVSSSGREEGASQSQGWMTALMDILSGWPRLRATEELDGNKIDPQVRARLDNLVRACENGADLTEFIAVLAKGSDSIEAPNYVSPILLSYSFMLWAKSNAVRPQDKKKVLNYVSGDYPFRVKWAAAQAAAALAGEKFDFTEQEKQSLLNIFAQINKNLSKENKNDETMYRVLVYLTGKLYDSPVTALEEATPVNSAYVESIELAVVLVSSESAAQLYLVALAGFATALYTGKAIEYATQGCLRHNYGNALDDSLERCEGTDAIIAEEIQSIPFNSSKYLAFGTALSASSAAVSAQAGRFEIDCQPRFGGDYSTNIKPLTQDRFFRMLNTSDAATKAAFEAWKKKNVPLKLRQNERAIFDALKKSPEWREFQEINRIGNRLENGFVKIVYRNGKWIPEIEVKIPVSGTPLKKLFVPQILEKIVDCSTGVAQLVKGRISLADGVSYRYGKHEQLKNHLHYETFNEVDDISFLCNKSIDFDEEDLAAFLAGVDCVLN